MAALPLPDGGKAARKYTRADFSRMTDEEVVRVAQEGSEDAYDYLLRKSKSWSTSGPARIFCRAPKTTTCCRKA